MKTGAAVIACLFAFVSALHGQSPERRHLTGPLNAPGTPITDLKTLLAGTSWQAAPISHTRPGLSADLTFGDETVAPAGYKYDVGAGDSFTIHFNHGDTQTMQMAPDGMHLKFTFQGNDFVYELIEPGDKPALNLKTGLAGTTWRAVPMNHPRLGLAGHLTFGDGTVSPASYKCDVNSEISLTIHFNHGDTQLMLLSPDGKHLKFIFDKKDYEYEFVSK